MKKLMTTVTVLLLALTVFGSGTIAEDAVSSATLSIHSLPEIRENAETKILVAYFSTDDLSADLFEIQPAEPYTADDVNYHNRQSRTSIEQNDPQARPEIAALPEDMSRYDTIILGYPIWWGQAPKILYTFVESVDFSGKTVIPFCTSGSSGAGSSAANLQKAADESSVWLETRRISNGSTGEEIRVWAESLANET